MRTLTPEEYRALLQVRDRLIDAAELSALEVVLQQLKPGLQRLRAIQRRWNTVLCPVCKEVEFFQDAKGWPKTCSKVCGAKLAARNRKKCASQEVLNLVAPDGTLYRWIRNLEAFAEEHELDFEEIQKVAEGVLNEYKGWSRSTKAKTPKKKQRISTNREYLFKSLRAPDGTVHKKSEENTAQLAEQYGLNAYEVLRLAIGLIDEYKGWTRVEEE